MERICSECGTTIIPESQEDSSLPFLCSLCIIRPSGQSSEAPEPSQSSASSFPDSHRLLIAKIEAKFTKIKEMEEREFSESLLNFDNSAQEILRTVQETLTNRRQNLVNNHSKFQTLLQSLAPSSPSQNLQYADSRLNVLLTQPRLIDYAPEKMSNLKATLSRFLKFGDQSDSLLNGFGCVPLLIRNSLIKCPFVEGQTEHNPLPIQTTIDSGSSYCVFWDAKMLVTGGKFHSDCYSIDPFTSEVRKTTSMLSARAFHGLLFTHGAVHVFGGSVSTGLLNLCEVYAPEAESWHALPKMIYNRHGINPCEIASKVYIAGGGANTIEVFDISAQFFSSLPIMLPGIKWTTCFNLDGLLCLLHVGKMYRVDPAESTPTLKLVREIEKKSWWSNLQPFDHDGWVYFLHPFNEAREVMKLRKADWRMCKVADFNP